MSEYRSRNQLVLVEIETDAGVEETPAAATNAVRVRQDARFSPNLEQLDTDYVQDSLTNSAPIAGGGDASMQLGAFLACPASPGANAPDYGALIQGAGFEQVQLAADLTGAAPAAGTTTTVPLASGASSTSGYYVGMVIEVGGTRRVITAYNGGTKIATLNAPLENAVAETDTYTIKACTLYKPIDAAFKTLTAWHYFHHQNGTSSKRRRIKGAMSGLQMSVAPRGLANIDFPLRGQFVAAPDDVSKPTGAVYQAGDPQPLINALVYLGDKPIKMSSFRFDLGMQPEMFDNPAEAFGYDPASPTNRRATGSIVPNKVLNSERDVFADWVNGADRSIWLDWGVSGRRVSLFIPQARNTNVQDQDVRGYVADAVDFRSIARAGEIYICLHA